MPRPLIPQRRERILDVAEDLILDSGFDAVTVAAVAERVGIAKGAVYREFASKHDILDELLRRSMERMQVRSRELLGDDPTPPLSAAYRVGTRALLDEPLMVAAFLDDAGVLGSYVDTVTDGRYRERYLATGAWIRDLQASGRLSADVDPDALALALSSATLGLLTAAKQLGPLSPAQFEAALGAIETMVARLEPRD